MITIRHLGKGRIQLIPVPLGELTKLEIVKTLNHVSHVLAVAMSLFWSNAIAQPEEIDLRPAQLTDGRSSLQNRIEFPNIEKNVNVTIYCRSTISKRGDLEYLECLDLDEDKAPFWNAIKKQSKYVNLLPAIYDGKKTAVRFQFAVNFQKIDDHEIIQVIPNHGHNKEQFGLDYSSAQRAHVDEFIFGVKASRMNTACVDGYEFFIESIVNATGDVESSRALLSSGSSECESLVIDHLKSSKYVPAFKSGRAVASKIVEHFLKVARVY